MRKKREKRKTMKVMSIQSYEIPQGITPSQVKSDEKETKSLPYERWLDRSSNDQKKKTVKFR